MYLARLINHGRMSPEAREFAASIHHGTATVHSLTADDVLADTAPVPARQYCGLMTVAHLGHHASPLAKHIAASRYTRRLTYRELRACGVEETSIKRLAVKGGMPLVAQALQVAHLPVTLAVYYRSDRTYWLMPLNGNGQHCQAQQTDYVPFDHAQHYNG